MRIVILLLASLVLFTGALTAAEPGHEQILFQLFNGEGNQIADMFDAAFLAQVPAQTLASVVKQYTANLGALVEVTGSGGKYTLIFEKGRAPGQLSTNPASKITGLWLGNWTLSGDTLESVLEDLKAIGGQVSACVTKNGHEVVLGYNEDRPMAVGSTYKLFVLKSVYDMVDAGKASWDTIIRIDEADKSLPTGILQSWPDNTPVTLKTLTSLMISISDNTAADHLLEYIGRSSIEKHLAEYSRPLLKTHEVFRLKYGSDDSLREAYVKGSESEKRHMLEGLSGSSLDALNVSSSPVLINEIEWFFTTRELCDVIYELRHADEIGINPGLASKGDWAVVGYKGGSEPGVLQYTHLLQKSPGGDFYSVSVTANNADAALDINEVTKVTSRLVAVVGDTSASHNQE